MDKNNKSRNLKIIALAIVMLLAVAGIFLFVSGIIGLSKTERAALKDIKTLKSVLLNPKSLEIKDAYVSFNYSDKNNSTVLFIGALGNDGLMYSNYALIIGKDVYFDNDVFDNENKISKKKTSSAGEALIEKAISQIALKGDVNGVRWYQVTIEK